MYGNGINGVVVHHTSNVIVTNNVAYLNGTTLIEAGRGNSSGVTWNDGSHGWVANNISWARLTTDYAYALIDGDKC